MCQGEKRGAGIIHIKAVGLGHKGSRVMLDVLPWGAGLGCPHALCSASETQLGAAPEARREQQQGWKGCRDGQQELMQ